MAIDAFEDWIVKRLGDKLAAAIDNGILNGRGAETYNEMLGICADATVTTVSDDIDYEGLCKLMKSVKHKNNGKFVMNAATLWDKIAQIKDEEGRPIFMPNAEEGMAGRIFGYPVLEDSNCADNTVVFGNFKKYTLNFNKPIAIDRDESTDFRYGNTVFRGMTLVDGRVVNKNAFAVLKETQSA